MLFRSHRNPVAIRETHHGGDLVGSSRPDDNFGQGDLLERVLSVLRAVVRRRRHVLFADDRLKFEYYLIVIHRQTISTGRSGRGRSDPALCVETPADARLAVLASGDPAPVNCSP